MWTEEGIRARITEFENGIGWYQNIDLGNGIQTKSRSIWGEEIDHPRFRWGEVAKAVPSDLKGLSVLDIGCNAGYFSFEAKRRGAHYICGVDSKQEYIEQAKFCNDVLGFDVDFRVQTVYDLDKLDRQFDLVFFVGVLYHCKYLSQAVEQASKAAKKRIIVESAIHPGAVETPLVRLVAGSEKLPGTWHPNMSALHDLFRAHDFSTIETLFVKGGRGGIVADK